MKKSKKSELTSELEKIFLEKKSFQFKDIKFCDAIFVDVMLRCRQLKFKDCKVFKDFAEKFANSLKNYNTTVRQIHFVFDDYFDDSPKFCERDLRYKGDCIKKKTISENVPVPVQENTFWGSKLNKIRLQKFLQEYLIRNSSHHFHGVDIVCSGTSQMDCQSTDSNLDLHELQRKDLEEADSVANGLTDILVLSSDTDVVVLLIYYYNKFWRNKTQVFIFIKFSFYN